MASPKGITVKVTTSKVIKALEVKSAELTKIQSAYDKEHAELEAIKLAHEKAKEKYQKDLIKAVLPHISKSPKCGVYFRGFSNEINVDIYFSAADITLPVEPTQASFKWTTTNVRQELDEINNTIRILKMTDDETVNASTFNKISQYL